MKLKGPEMSVALSVCANVKLKDQKHLWHYQFVLTCAYLVTKQKKEFLEPEDVLVLVSVLLYQGLH